VAAAAPDGQPIHLPQFPLASQKKNMGEVATMCWLHALQ